MDYKNIAIDGQYFLVRHFNSLKSRTAMDCVAFLDESEGDPTEGYVIRKSQVTVPDIVRQFFWSIAKLVREYADCGRLILLWDSSPYHKIKMLPDFKGDRFHISQDVIDEFDIKSDPIRYLQLKEDLRLDKLKVQAKYWLIDNLIKIGVPSVIQKGYEADDLAIIFSDLLKEDDMKSAICSVDSDWMYWINSNIDLIHPTKLDTWVYQDVLDECENKLEKLGLSLFEAKCYMDSLFNSHNGLKPTTAYRWRDFEDLIQDIRSETFSMIDDVERFKLNMKSFDVYSYPEIETVKNNFKSILNHVPRKEVLIENFDKLSKSEFKISRDYFLNKFLDYCTLN